MQIRFDMTREEEIMKAARVYADGIAQHLPNKKYCEEDFIAGVKWADETMINKACEWLTRELCYTARGNNLFNNKTATDEFVESFYKAMKGGEQ